MPFDSFVDDKIAVSFNSDPELFKQELTAFLTLCASHDLKWRIGDPALDADMVYYLPVGYCICYLDINICPPDPRIGLACSEEQDFLKDGYTIVPSTEFDFNLKELGLESHVKEEVAMKIICSCGNEISLKPSSDEELRKFVGDECDQEDIDTFKEEYGTLCVLSTEYPYKSIEVTPDSWDEMLTFKCDSCKKVFSISTYR